MTSPANRGQGRKPGSKNKQLQELREVLYKYSDNVDQVFKDVFEHGDLDQQLKAVQMILNRTVPTLQSIEFEAEKEQVETNITKIFFTKLNESNEEDTE
jgi:hypothetical protein